jgi:hypothetical protein
MPLLLEPHSLASVIQNAACRPVSALGFPVNTHAIMTYATIQGSLVTIKGSLVTYYPLLPLCYPSVTLC